MKAYEKALELNSHVSVALKGKGTLSKQIK